jgi:hypothetical protein
MAFYTTLHHFAPLIGSFYRINGNLSREKIKKNSAGNLINIGFPHK